MTEELATLRGAVEHIAKLGGVDLCPHQLAAFSAADEALSQQARREFSDTWRAVGSPAAPVPPRDGRILLPVPYFSQVDSATEQGRRMCFSSSCAMAAEFLKPGCLAGPGQPDDRYLRIVQRFGDTTSADAQIKALDSLGIRARFRADGTIHGPGGLVEELRAGRPAAVGWLHHGPVSAPRGGGHWTLAIGWDPAPNVRRVVMHDPYGEADLAQGGYVSTAVGRGRAILYSAANWGRRWEVDSAGNLAPGRGWWIQFLP